MKTVQTGILTPADFKILSSNAISLTEAQLDEPEGVYTVTRTYHGNKALLLNRHLDRLEESARVENIPLQLDRGALRAVLRKMISASGYSDSRFRITVSRANPDEIYLAMEMLKPVPEQLRKSGVKVATIAAQRQNPIAKTTVWMEKRQQAAANLPNDIYESLVTGENGELLEGGGSNFYAILDGVLRTAAESLILNGISRRVLLVSVGDTLSVKFTAVTINDIPLLSEAFLTSSSRAIVPIVEIDGQKIGTGEPGEMTRELHRRYDEWTAAHLEPI